MIGKYYIIDNGNIRTVELEEWGRWFQKTPNRVIEKTDLGEAGTVSTVFLGIDHNFSHVGPPVLFETMVFGGAMDQEMQRYATLGDAKRGHFEMVDRVRAGA